MELNRTRDELTRNAIQTIAKKWKGRDFETFINSLLARMIGIDVKLWGDSGKGWDFLIRIYDPITNEILIDDIPAQCKNYEGVVHTEKPIEDLERCVRNSESSLFYLFIIGDLSDEYTKKIYAKQEELSGELKRHIEFRVVDQNRIAELYILAQPFESTS